MAGSSHAGYYNIEIPSYQLETAPPRPQRPSPSQIAAGALPEPLPGPVAVANLYPSPQAAQC